MCVRIRAATRVTQPWNAETETITVPAGLCPQLMITAIRTVLSKLAVEQSTAGAVCWCGRPVDLDQVVRIPIQRNDEVTTIGA